MVQQYCTSAVVALPSFTGLLRPGQSCLQQAPPPAAAAMPALSAQWRGAVPVGCGLANLGNSCYLNSAIQCLAHLPPLANLCLARAHSRQCRAAAPRGCVCCLLEAQVVRMLQHPGGGGADAPTGLHGALHALNKGFVRGRQEDAHELLRCLVDAMELALLRQSGAFDPQRPPRQPRTLVNAIFGGILQSQVLCLACGHASSTWDPCMDLSLELGGCASVEDALRRFTAVEKLDGANKYRCEGCKHLVPAHKQMTVYDDPNVLVVHLKRFDGFMGAKITRDVSFSTTLDLEPFVSPGRRLQQPEQQQQQQAACSSGGGRPSCSGSGLSGPLNNSAGGGGGGSVSSGSSGDGGGGGGGGGGSGRDPYPIRSRQASAGAGAGDPPRTTRARYELRGVLVHHGLSAGSGHYLAYVKDGQPPGGGYWHCMNDSTVYRVAESKVLDQQAYILFYVRTAMKPQASLPQHTESGGPAQPQPQPQAAQAPARLKRASSTGGGGDTPVIGPQLPPHLLAKRQRLSEGEAGQQQQQQQPGSPDPRPPRRSAADGGEQEEQEEDMFAPGEPGAAGGPAYGPQLPPGWASQRGGSTGAQAVPAPSEPPDAGARGGAGAGARVFAWARQQPQQQQQQAEPAPAPAGAARQASSSPLPLPADRPGMQAAVELRLRDAHRQAEPWLRSRLLAARTAGRTRSQSKADLFGQYASLPALVRAKEELFRRLPC